MKPRPADDPTALRRAAEARLSARPTDAPASEADLRRLQHELEVHQAELELQNEQLQAARAELEAGLERYTDLYDHAPVAYFSLQADGTIHLVNLTGARLLGRERAHLLGRRFGLFVAETDRRAFSDFLAAAFATATPQVSELELRSEGQPPRWVHLAGTLAADRQECRLTATDITERRQAEMARCEAAAALSATLNALPAHIALVDPQGVILSVNEAWQRFATANGLSDGSFGIGRNYLSLCDSAIGGCSDEALAVAAGIRSVLQGQAKEFSLDYPCHSPTEQHWFRLTATAVHTGTLSGAVVMHVNITDRKLTELRIGQLNRVYATLSEVNQRIVRERDLQGMLEAACRLAVERGEFRMAWVGLLDAATQTVIPKAAAGAAGDYPQTVNINLLDTGRNQGPTARALLTGEHQVCNDLANDPRFAPWRETAHARGFRASAAFPLHLGGKPAGALNLYAGEPGFFTDEKLRLLDGLAMDLSFALEIHEHQQANRLAEQQLRWHAAFLEAQVDSSFDGLLVVDGQGKKLLQNARFNELWKIPRPLIDTQDDAEQVRFATSQTKHPQQFAERVAYLYAHPEATGRDEIELTDGTVLDRYSAPVRGRDGQYYGRIWSFRDITERKRAAEALRKRTAFLEAMIDSSADGVLVVDPQKNRLYQNAKLAELYGIPRGIAENPDYEAQLEFVSNRAKDPQEFRGRVAFMYANPKETSHDEFELVDGTFLERTSAPVLGKDGELFGRIWHFRNVTPRRRAAEALVLTAQLLERTGELAKIGGWSVDLPTMKLSWTRETFRIAEIEPPIEPPLAEGINLFAPEARPIIAAAVQAAMDTGTPYDLELPIITAQGRHLWVRTQGFGEMRDGKTVRIYGTFQDITARREAEASLRASEVRLERTLDGAHIGHWDLDLVTHAAHRSLQHDQIFGYEELLPEWTYEKFLTHVLPEDRAEVDRSFRAGVAAKTEWGFECRITRRDGAQRWIWAHGNVLTNALGGAVRMFGVVRDITASKELEASLRASESRSRLLVRAANVGLWDWDLATGSLYFSPEWKAQLGYADHELPSRFEEWESRLHPEDRAATLAAVAEFQAGSRLTYDVEFRLRHRDGSWRWILTQAEIARDEGGRAVRMTGSHIDITARKAIELAMIESEERWRFAIEGAGDGLWDWNVPAGTVFFSRRFIEMLGFAEHEFSDRLEEWSSRVHPDDLPLALADVQRHLDGVTPVYTNEHRCRCKDGSWKWILDRGLVIARDDTGKPVRMIGTHSDITTRKQTEAALEASEAKSRAIVEASPVPMALNDADLTILFLNPAFTQTFGYELGDIPTLCDWWPKAYPDPVYRQWVAETWQRELARSSQTGTDFAPFELRIRCKDGTERIVMVSAAPLEDAFAGTHLVVLHDITERKRAEEALRASRHHLEQAQVVGHIGSWISEPGPPARLVWSAETCRIFGVAPGAFDGRPETFIALVHPEDRARVARAWQAAQAGGPAYDLEHRIVRPDGQERWVHEQADLERDPAGQILRLVGVVQDITDRKHLEEQLRQAQKMEAIGQLAGGIAHDFNNILGSILGNAELIRLLPPGSPETGECLDDILIASRRAAELVGQILAFSRRQESRRLPIQLQPVVREALKLLRATVTAQVEFRPRLASVPAVLADPSELHSVIMNLCTNAWHALLGRGGLITVELAEVELDEDFTRRHPDLRPGRYVCLTVADDGCGMDETTLARIFEPFFTTKPVGMGTGLGLSVVHGIVKNHDGAIVVQSRPGAGTTFQLYFPVFATEAPAAAPPPKPAPRGAGEHILFVDDEEPLARMGTRALERLGYRVTPHTRPTEALAAFRAQPTDFDLVVVDYNMPVLNGTEFGAQVLEVRPVQRIILATGYSATLTPEAARDLGFRELMPKPYDLNSLGETVQRALHGNELRP